MSKDPLKHEEREHGSWRACRCVHCYSGRRTLSILLRRAARHKLKVKLTKEPDDE